MNKGEKRNFKLLAGLMAGDKKYIELFDLIDRQNAYDETKLAKSDLYGGQLSVAKNYLFRFLLKSLVHYNSDPVAEMNQFKEQARILISRNLLSQARKALRKAFKIAEKLEAFETMHELLNLEMKIFLREPDKWTGRIVSAEKARELKKKWLEQIKNLNDFQFLAAKLEGSQKAKSPILYKTDPPQWKEIANHPLLDSAENAISQRAAIYFHSLKGKIFLYDKGWDGALMHFQAVVDIFAQNPALLKSRLSEYLAVSWQIVACFSGMGQVENALEQLEKFRNIKEVFPQARSEIQQLDYIFQLTVAVHNGPAERGLDLVSEVQKEIERSGERMKDSRILAMYYLMAYLHFLVGEHSKCLRFLQSFFEMPKNSFHKGFQLWARLLRLMLYFEMGDYLVLGNEAENVQRMISKYFSGAHISELIVKGLRKMAKEVGTKPDVELAKGVLAEFRAEKQAYSFSNDLSVLDFDLWLRSLLEKKPMEDLRKDSK